MGMNHAGEIARLAAIAAPQVGVVTNVGAVHLGFFRSVDAIAEAKRELIEALPANGVAVLNADDPRVSRFGEKFAGRCIYFGTAGAPRNSSPKRPGVFVSDVRLLGDAGSEFAATVFADKHTETDGRLGVRLPLLGTHNILNAAAAIAVGVVFGIDLEQSAEALSAMQPTGSRGQIRRVGDITLIDDSYNSNPPALENMLGVLMAIPGKRHIVVVGEMLELGDATPDLHRRAGEVIARSGADALFAVRGAARYFIEGATSSGFRGPLFFFESVEQCGPALRDFLRPGDVVLAKASRGVRLERALTELVGEAVAQ
jgi:UDP-N-acetylmuramoyl-tripeptide--D-alanyl-D-alanine ligase